MFDNHDIAIQEKMDIVGVCFERHVNSVIVSNPTLEELMSFKKCVRKHCRVKMRSINYYHNELHGQRNSDGEFMSEDYLLTNI